MQIRSWTNLKNRASAMIQRRWKESSAGVALPRMLALEDRTLFNADPFADPSAMIAEVDDGLIFAELFAQIDELATISQSGIPLITFEDMRVAATTQDIVFGPLSGDSHIDVRPAVTANDVREVIIIDSSIDNFQDLIDDISKVDNVNREVIVVSAGADGLGQISEALKNHSGLQAIHILSHGNEQGIQIGGVWLGNENAAAHSDQIVAWGSALAADGDLLLYGCNVAGNESGREFLQWLGATIQADIAASTDLTGSSSLGGDWDLEYRSGPIETLVLVGDRTRPNWDGLLATVTVSTSADIVDGDTTSIASLITNQGFDGQISLREAIAAANNTPNGSGPDAINFAIPDSDAGHFYYRDDGIAGSLTLAVTTTLSDVLISDFDPDYPYAAHSWFRINLSAAAVELDITDAVLIDGYSQPGATQNTLSIGHNASLRIELTSLGADGNRGINVEAGGAGSTIQGLAINRFDWSGILTDTWADGVTIQGNYIGTDITGTIDLGNGDAGVHLRSSGNLVGGSSLQDRNIISGNSNRGVVTFSGSTEANNILENNYIGVDATGMQELGNTDAGIQVYNQSDMQILDNLISGNSTHGIWIRSGSSANSTIIHGNLIGVAADGVSAIGNGEDGILIEASATNTTIGGILAGEGNTIAFNVSDGIAVTNGIGAAIRGNSIFSNGARGIDLNDDDVTLNDLGDADVGPNGLRNFPVIITAVIGGTDFAVTGSLNTLALTNCDLDFYWSLAGDPSGHGEGQNYIGSFNVTTNGSGDSNFSHTFIGASVPIGAVITATSTDSSGNTSEFALDSTSTVALTGQIWFTTDGNGSTPTATWDNKDIIKFTDPNLKYEPVDGTTAGTHSLLPGFNAPDPIRAMHYVQTNITVGTIPGRMFNLQTGDLLVTFEGGGSVDGVTYDRKDILVYRPSAPGNYSTGTHFMLLDNGIQDGGGSFESHAIHLVEHDTTVGGTVLSRGTFIVAHSGGSVDDNLYVFSANGTGVGANTDTSTIQLLLDGDLLGFNNKQIQGLQLVEETMVVGTTTLNAGTLLINVRGMTPMSVPGNAGENDVFMLKVGSTELDSPGSTSGVTALFYDGADVGMSAGSEGVDSITLIPFTTNSPPTDIAPNNFSVAELTDTNGGYSVGTLIVSDPDAFDTFTYSILPGGDDAKFSIGGANSDELILTHGVLNFEAQSSYSVLVRVTDSAGNSWQETLTVNVVDLNELPVINSQTFPINENSSYGTVVGNVVAADQDSGANGTLTYAIAGGSGATTFSINATNGEITVVDASQLNFEASSSFSLQIQVSDGGALSLSSTATITINLLDVNETPTDIAPDSMTLPENTNTSSGLSLGVLTATDVDAAETFTFTILPGGDAARFSIGGVGSNELILTDGILDFETQSSYSVTVRVTDSGGNFDDETVTVDVVDVNELPTINNQSFAIVENTPNGTVVGSVLAGDQDSGANGIPSYSIVGGTGATAFAINSISGQITVADQSQLDFESTTSFTLQVQVSDGGMPSLSAAAIVVINLLDGNEVPTDLMPNGFTVVENTDTTGGVSLGILTATDPDALDTFTYSIRPGLDGASFSIGGGGSDELILTDGAIDFERQSNYNVTIRVTDSAGNFYDETLTITVIDINEDPTADVGGPYAIDEGSGVSLDGPGSSDPEGGALTYRWDLNNDGAFGDIVGASPTLGWGTLNSWGITNQGVHTIGLQVSDAAGNAHSTTTTLTVNNLAPAAGSDSGVGFESDEDNSFITGNVVTNDSDPNSNDVLSVAGLDLTGTRGLVIDNGNGTFTYDPNGQFENLNVGGTAFDSFIYLLEDEAGASVFGTVVVTIYGVNDEQLVVANNGLTVNEAASSTISSSSLSTGDVDDATVDLVYIVTQATANGHLELAVNPGIAVSIFTQAQIDNGEVRYSHNGGETLGDSFKFTVDDGQGTTSAGTFIIAVTPVNDAPTAADDSASATQGIAITIDRSSLLSNDNDVDSSSLAIQIIAGPANGIVIANADGSFAYQSAIGFFGTDSFQYKLSDGSATSNTAIVTIQVVPAGSTGASTQNTPPSQTTVTTSSPTPALAPPQANVVSETISGTAEKPRDVADQPSPKRFLGREDLAISSTRIEEQIDSENQSWTRVYVGARNSDDESSRRQESSDVKFTNRGGVFWNALDKFSRQAENITGSPILVTGGTAALTTSISVGYVVWLIRGGQVLAALMTHLPAWSLIDPLPILGSFDKRDDETDDSLQSLLDESEPVSETKAESESTAVDSVVAPTDAEVSQTA